MKSHRFAYLALGFIVALAIGAVTYNHLGAIYSLTVVNDGAIGGDLAVSGAVSGASLTLAGGASVNGGIEAGATIVAPGSSVNGDVAASGAVSGSSLALSGGASVTGTLTVGSTLNLNKLTKLTIFPAAGTCSGFYVQDSQVLAGTTLVFGNAVYEDVFAKIKPADADAAGTMPAIAIAMAGINKDASGPLLFWGFCNNAAWNWSMGDLLYVSTTTGALTQTAPSGSGDVIQAVGVALTDDIIYFNPSMSTEVVP